MKEQSRIFLRKDLVSDGVELVEIDEDYVCCVAGPITIKIILSGIGELMSPDIDQIINAHASIAVHIRIPPDEEDSRYCRISLTSRYCQIDPIRARHGISVSHDNACASGPVSEAPEVPTNRRAVGSAGRSVEGHRLSDG